MSIEKKNMMVLQDEGSWALMVEECNALAIRNYHGKMAGLSIEYYLSLGNSRYYKDYLRLDNIYENQNRMIEFLADDDKYTVCIDEIMNILNQLRNVEDYYKGKTRLQKFQIYCNLLCEYIAYYNSVIADVFYEKVYEIVERKIPNRLKFAQKAIKDALFATNNINLLSHMQSVELICLADKFLQNRLSEEEVLKYIEKYRSTTASSGNPNGVTVDEIMRILRTYTIDEINIEKAFIDNLHFRYLNAKKWSNETARMLNLDMRTKLIAQRTSELSYLKILMREEFQQFKISTRKNFLNELISEIGKNEFDYMRIDEIVDYINDKKRVSQVEIEQRKKQSVFELIGDTLNFSNQVPKNVALQNEHSRVELSGDVLIGSGCKKYKVKKVRQDEAGLLNFDKYIISEKDKENVAIVTNVLRPFLVPKLKEFGVLLTQYGGYTSHASVLCRELGINSVISIDGLMDSLESNDYIEINFDEGIIRKVEEIENEEIEDDKIFIPLQANVEFSRDRVGSKAANIMRLSQKSIIPKGFVLTTYALENIDEPNIQDVVMEQIATLNCSLIVIRSSHESEDREHSSYAGLYESFVNVNARDQKQIIDLIKAVYQSGFSEHLDDYVDKRQGSMHVIIQEMIKADISGVMLTSVAQSGYEYMQNEYLVGDLCYLMQGEVTPAITYIEKRDIIDKRCEFRTYPALIDPKVSQLFYRLACIALELERMFVHRLEIEWGIKDQTVYIFQARYY